MIDTTDGFSLDFGPDLKVMYDAATFAHLNLVANQVLDLVKQKCSRPTDAMVATAMAAVLIVADSEHDAMSTAASDGGYAVARGATGMIIASLAKQFTVVKGVTPPTSEAAA